MKIQTIMLLTAVLLLTGCRSTGENPWQNSAEKNTTLEGYLLYGSGETMNPETISPEAKMITGRVSYKSRNVSVPEGTKTPNTGFFKSIRTISFFGTEEEIIEYDFTAENQESANVISKYLSQSAVKIKSNRAE